MLRTLAALSALAFSLSACVNTSLGRLEVVNAHLYQDGEALELLVARESKYKVEPAADEVWTTLLYELYVVNLPASAGFSAWHSLEGERRKILTFDGPPPKGVDYYYAAGTLFSHHATLLKWCAVQTDNSCKNVGELPLDANESRIAYDRDGIYFFAANQLFSTDRSQPLLNLSGRHGYQKFLEGRLDRRLLVAHRWLLAASHRAQKVGAPILQIYDIEEDTVQTVVSQSMPHDDYVELLAVDKNSEGWMLLLLQKKCKEVEATSGMNKSIECDDYYAVQKPGQPGIQTIQLASVHREKIGWRLEFEHWDSKHMRLWQFEAMNRHDKQRGIEAIAFQYQ